jgi:uncharacterized membrane protein
MTQRQFLQKLQDQRIVKAIRAAEAKSSGEIRVYISERIIDDALVAAREQFVKLDMTRTKQRNGVLIFVAPESQTFAVVGDEAVHARCGDGFWNGVVEEIGKHFKNDAMTDAITGAVEKVGSLLSEHFPRSPDDQNELPDQVERGT